ncbi:hypothetical protein SAMD00023353_0303140 [Rosellinia necatrix]|uniref:Uncharacterized protein n=1 Tax=Rosellinia necatrix TaxID=77044 RepID=A0A1W2TDV5_ROSNE|nr:hypothetical protein SAMD00023353_0303140 [Rosellinia necatrix]
MDTTPEEGLAAKRAREVLLRLLRPRGELIAEKRTMVQELAQGLGQEQLGSPVFLVDPDKPASPSDVPHENQREFIEAVQRNIELQKELSRLRAEHKTAVSTTAPAPTSARAEVERKLLEEQLESNRLEKERQRLEALNRYYEGLDRQPAAALDFLDPKVMFRDCATFPELPKEFVEGFTKDQEAPDQEAQKLVSRLRKATLRQKLVLEHDQRKLEGLKARDPIDPRDVSREAQVAALSAVKNSLVNWIETMLSKAGEGESEETGGSHERENEDGDLGGDAQLADVEQEYKRHIELRKQIVASMYQLRQLKESPRPRAEAQKPALVVSASVNPGPQTYLLTPYLEKLQALSHEQKGFIQEKAHINAAITRQQQETSKALRHLAQDSKLLSSYAPPKSKKPNSGMSFTKATKGASIAEQIQPWLFAADSAKIATLEAVAEAVEKGQASIDEAIQALDQVSMLQNKGPLQVTGSSEAELANTVTESAEGGEQSSSSPEKRGEKNSANDGQKSIWASLDGNLGLINQ